MKIPFLKPEIHEDDIAVAGEAIRSGWLATGPVVSNFEKNFANYFGVKGATVCSSGTAALHATLAVAEVGKGDEVITSALSFFGSSNVILYVGAKHVFVDVDPETGLIDLLQVEKAITPKTKAIIPVHLYGAMVDMKKLKAIADKYDIKIIEDACHAIESEKDGIRPGQLSFAACFSFHAAKNITAGQGGAVTSNDEEVCAKVKKFCDSGMAKDGINRSMVMLGYKYSFTTFQAALLHSQLKRIEEQWQKRDELYCRYEEAFKNTAGIRFQKRNPKEKHAHHMFLIWVDPNIRDELRKKLAEKGVDTSVHFNPIHLEPYYKENFLYKRGDFPNAENIGLGVIALPLYPSLTAVEQDYVVEAVKSVI